MKESIFRKLLNNITYKNLSTVRIFNFLYCMKTLFLYGSYNHAVFRCDEQKKLAFLVLSKNANTSILSSMFYMGEDDVMLLRQNGGERDRVIDSMGYYRFAFVRNPFDRVVSAYTDKILNSEKNDEVCHAINAYSPYEVYLFGLLHRKMSFEEFVKVICHIPNCMNEQHFSLQYKDLYERHDKCRVDYIGRFEHLAEDYEPVALQYGLSPLPQLNASRRAGWMEYYTKETAELIYRKYRKDFEAFGYEDSYLELMQYLQKKETGASS